MEYSENDERVVEGDDWVETHIGHESLQKTDLQEIPGDSSAITAKSHASAAKDDDDDDVPDIEDADGDDDDIPDIDEFEEDNLEACDPSALAAPSAAAGDADDNILRTRTYDLYITYDKYYQTPRLWLFGHDESRKPLSVTKMYEDFSQDHAKKTVTMEAHPNLSITMASIHPCRHSNVMKKIISNVEVAGKELGVHLYLMIFLKFVQSVIPTIEYDYTREFSF
ncbi:autophagy protein ATG3, variant [Capsaspora owczarzaki ATCC 30864]|nr:autophagy protein ATG3, variant [Capsaspora owczarzaki ATCC 30864]